MKDLEVHMFMLGCCSVADGCITSSLKGIVALLGVLVSKCSIPLQDGGHASGGKLLGSDGVQVC